MRFLLCHKKSRRKLPGVVIGKSCKIKSYYTLCGLVKLDKNVIILLQGQEKPKT